MFIHGCHVLLNKEIFQIISKTLLNFTIVLLNIVQSAHYFLIFVMRAT